MAERRMFAKTIIDSDAFLDMPLSTQSLYFHLSMRADDEGFINNPKKIQRMIGASDDDAKMLIAKNFIIPFESGVVVIKHWKIHNYIRNDRLVATKYQDEKLQLTVKDNGAYTQIEKSNDSLELEELDSRDKRKMAYKKSSLPYSFDYKIKRAFEGQVCPVCGRVMTSSTKSLLPTIQHNIPISKGGVHEIENISVICETCNTSIKDKPTDALNNEQVVSIWDKIVTAEDNNTKWFWTPEILWQASDGQVTDNGQSMDGIGKDRIGKDSKKKVSKEKNKEKYGEFQNVLLTEAEYKKLKEKFPKDYGDRIDNLSIYMLSKGKQYKNHYATILSWARKEERNKPKPIEPKKYTAYKGEDWERDDFEKAEMPDEMRRMLGKVGKTI